MHDIYSIKKRDERLIIEKSEWLRIKNLNAENFALRSQVDKLQVACTALKQKVFNNSNQSKKKREIGRQTFNEWSSDTSPPPPPLRNGLSNSSQDRKKTSISLRREREEYSTDNNYIRGYIHRDVVNNDRVRDYDIRPSLSQDKERAFYRKQDKDLYITQKEEEKWKTMEREFEKEKEIERIREWEKEKERERIRERERVSQMERDNIREMRGKEREKEKDRGNLRNSNNSEGVEENVKVLLLAIDALKERERLSKMTKLEEEDFFNKHKELDLCLSSSVASHSLNNLKSSDRMDNSSSSLKNNNRKEENQYLDELGRVFGQKEKEYESIEEKSKDGRDNLFMSDLVGEKSNRIPFDFVKEQFFKTMAFASVEEKKKEEFDRERTTQELRDTNVYDEIRRLEVENEEDHMLNHSHTNDCSTLNCLTCLLHHKNHLKDVSLQNGLTTKLKKVESVYFSPPKRNCDQCDALLTSGFSSSLCSKCGNLGTEVKEVWKRIIN